MSHFQTPGRRGGTGEQGSLPVGYLGLGAVGLAACALLGVAARSEEFQSLVGTLLRLLAGWFAHPEALPW